MKFYSVEIARAARVLLQEIHQESQCWIEPITKDGVEYWAIFCQLGGQEIIVEDFEGLAAEYNFVKGA